MHENSSESTQTLVYTHRKKQIPTWICAQALEFSHIQASKVHKIKHVFRTWPLQEYVQQLHTTQKTQLTEHEHFALFGNVFLFHLLEKLLGRKNKQLSKERNSLKLQSHVKNQRREVSWLIFLCWLWIICWIILKELDGVPKNSLALKTYLYHP